MYVQYTGERLLGTHSMSTDSASTNDHQTPGDSPERERPTVLADICIAAVVADKALDGIRDNAGQGIYADDHPWWLASDVTNAAAADDERVILLLASEDKDEWLGWALIRILSVVDLSAGGFRSQCQFEKLTLMPEIFRDLDSVYLLPAEHQLQREQREGLAAHRQGVTRRDLHPYALCLKPDFIVPPK